MPSLKTRVAYQNMILADAGAALVAATNAASNAANEANEAVDQIESGTLDLAAVTVGGTRFVNVGDELVPEP